MGTIIIYNATLKVKQAIRLAWLLELGRDAVKKIGLTSRRYVVENYEEPSNAYTVIFFLNESHLILTTYPEEDLVELEFGSCKMVNEMALHEWLEEERVDLKLITAGCIRKNMDGSWSKGEEAWQTS